jgi:Na+-transporting NADH:ubiquinone oxidoreductase subunit B
VEFFSGTAMKKISFLKQKNMIRVLISLVPVELVSIYYFGWRVAIILIMASAAGLLTEWLMAQRRNGKVSIACFVTTSLLALSLPPTIPLWMVVVGSVIAVLFGKEAFGGFGKNIFNPAIVGRAFLYVCFPIAMTARFVPVFTDFPGGFAQWSFTARSSLPPSLSAKALSVTDAVTAATPMWARRDYGFATDLVKLVLGNIGDVFRYNGSDMMCAAGSIGEVSAVVILISALYLIITKTAQWRLIVAAFTGAILSTLTFRYLGGIESVPPLPFSLFSGGLFFAGVFMATDPVSAPKDRRSQWIYGIFIGFMIVFFRFRSIFAGGVAFSILLGNMCAPSLDLWIRRFFSSRKKKGTDKK